jgi:anion-transporting  ArsA/GET3 family ATPase
MPHPLLDRRLLFVTGKGGVGRSTVAQALGMFAARSGLRTIVAELAGSERAQHAFESHGERFRELELAPGLFTISIDPEHAMEEYLKIKVGPLGHALASSRLFAAFAMATPGMRELLSVGKIWELAQFERRTRDAAPYDLVIVDAPATGHSVGLLQTPRTFAELARVGPIASQASRVAATIADRSFTAVIAVCTPEEMPVTETIALNEALERQSFVIDSVILNARYPDRFSAAEAERLAALETDRPARAGAVASALSERARAQTQADQQERLEQAFPGAVWTLPYVFAAAIGRPELELLADALSQAMTADER